MVFPGETALLGWGVVRNEPWHFAGLFSSEEEATRHAAELGPEYEVHWGENKKGTDDFVFGASPPNHP